MAESLRARDSSIEAPINLFHYVVEISPRSIVPSAAMEAVDIRLLEPHYDAQRRELSVAGVVVRQILRPAKNLELVLEACDEDGWQPLTDDPLPGGHPDPIKRLHDTLDALNGVKRSRLKSNRLRKIGGNRPAYHVHFSTDGTGQGIRWKIVATDGSCAPAEARAQRR